MDESNDIESKCRILIPEDVIKIVHRMKNESFKIIDYQLNNQSKYKLGITGHHLHLKIKIQKSAGTNIETLNLFVKCIPFDNAKQLEITKSQGLYEREIYFFDTIVALLKSNYKIKKWSPKSFLTKEGLIVMENLISQGYKILHSLFDDYKILKSALGTLAVFHSASLLSETHLNLESEIPMSLKERHPHAFEEKVFAQTTLRKTWFNNIITLISNIAEHYGKDSKKVGQQLNRIYELIKPSKIHRNVICHSDIWKNNLMFDETKPIPNCLLVDFQTIRYAPLVLDVLQLLHLNTSHSFRTKYEKELIEYYHSIMEDTIKYNDLLGNVVIPTKEEILFGLKDLSIYGAILACTYIPVTMLDSKIVSNITNNGENVGELFFSDRTKFTLDHMKEDESYKMKMLEAISELIDN